MGALYWAVIALAILAELLLLYALFGANRRLGAMRDSDLDARLRRHGERGSRDQSVLDPYEITDATAAPCDLDHHITGEPPCTLH